MRVLTWDEFNKCVAFMTNDSLNKKFSGVFGFPRGGLCLAVALSHTLSLPLLYKPKPNALIVDDIYDTGKTLNIVKNIPGITTFVWLSRVEPVWWNTVELITSDEWIVFPWEDTSKADKDRTSYLLSRSNH